MERRGLTVGGANGKLGSKLRATCKYPAAKNSLASRCIVHFSLAKLLQLTNDNVLVYHSVKINFVLPWPLLQREQI